MLRGGSYYLFNQESVTEVHINCCSHLCFDILGQTLQFLYFCQEDVVKAARKIWRSRWIPWKYITEVLCSGADSIWNPRLFESFVFLWRLECKSCSVSLGCFEKSFQIFLAQVSVKRIRVTRLFGWTVRAGL